MLEKEGWRELEAYPRKVYFTFNGNIVTEQDYRENKHIVQHWISEFLLGSLSAHDEAFKSDTTIKVYVYLKNLMYQHQTTGKAIDMEDELLFWQMTELTSRGLDLDSFVEMREIANLRPTP